MFDGDYILFSEDGINVVDEQGHPALQFLHGKFWLNNHAHILQGNDIISNELLYLQLKNTNVRHLVTGAAQPKINQKNMNSIELIIADKITTVEINKIIKPLFNYIAVNEKEIAKLQKLKQLVISRISGM
ncbi:MAG: restriction endonuclease subunit S [Treponema sp.]|nr:restriction endonuclease subunit S [Treponema sp.]